MKNIASYFNLHFLISTAVKKYGIEEMLHMFSLIYSFLKIESNLEFYKL